jgi:four helix bundle protein
MKNNVLNPKSISFAVRIINLAKFLNEQREYVIAKQVVRSGTAIGALIREAHFAESRADYIHKLHISLKEANESDYWILLLKESEYISEKEYQSLYFDVQELIKLLVATIKTTKQNSSRNKK